MKHSLNRVALIGHLAASPELKTQILNNEPLLRFRVAINRDWKDKDGVTYGAVDFHRVFCTGKLAETYATILTKGAGVYVEGSLLNRAYTNAEGFPCSMTEIEATGINLLVLTKTNDIETIELADISK